MIEITLPWPAKELSPNSRCHWREKAEATLDAKEQGCYAVLEIQTVWPIDADIQPSPFPDKFEACYKFHPPDRRKRDIDNCLAMMKAYQDGVCAAIGIDDSRIRRTVLEWGEVVKGGRVVLRLEELDT